MRDNRGEQIGFPWALILAWFVIYLSLQALFVGQSGISSSSEAREVQVIDVILRDGTWALPLRNGVIPSKPPLYHWLGAGVSIVAGGVSEFSARFTSQTCCALTMILVSLTTFKFASLTRTYQGNRHPRRAALIACAVASLTYGLYQMGCLAMVDMTFTLTFWLALAAVILGIRSSSIDGTYLSEFGRTFFWFFCALAVLARGPIGLVLPVALAGMAGICVVGLKKAAGLFLRPSFGWLAVLIPLVWYYLAYRVGGDAFVQRQILFENIKRFSGGEFVNSESWWFYFPSLLRTTFPWGVILLMFLFKGVISKSTVSYPGSKALSRWLPSILLFFGLGLLSLSSGKRHSYLVPLLPLIAVQLGVEISSAFERGGAPLRVRTLRAGRATEFSLTVFAMIFIFGISALIELGILSNVELRDAYAAIPMVIARLAIIIGAIAIVTVIGARKGVFGSLISVWFLMVVIMTGVVNGGLAVKAHLKGFDDMARTWLDTAAKGDRLAVFKHQFDEYFDPILFYVRRPVELLSLDSFSRECDPGTVYAGKRSWLDAHEDLFRGDIIRIVTLRERFLARRGDSQRDLVFFRCSKYRREDAPREPEQMLRDAGLWFKRRGNHRG